MSENFKIPANLSIKNITYLNIYFLVLIILNTFITLFFLYQETYFSKTLGILSILIPCIAFSTVASCIYYLRKLYKLCLGEKINNDKTTHPLLRIGTLMYFITRPLFAGIFAIVLILAVNSGFLLISNSDINTNRLNYLYIVISFFIGFSSGNFLSFLEKKADTFIDSL